MFSVITTFTAFSFLAFVSASPLDTRSTTTCSPNLGGASLSIFKFPKEWSLGSSPPVAGDALVIRHYQLHNNEFRVEATDRSDWNVLIKPFGFPQLRVAASGSGKLHIATPNSTDLTQEWHILCRQCGHRMSGTFAAGCTIRSAANGKCVHMDSSSLSLANCNSSPKQSFTFGTA